MDLPARSFDLARPGVAPPLATVYGQLAVISGQRAYDNVSVYKQIDEHSVKFNMYFWLCNTKISGNRLT